ncbi:MAG TPA: alpha-2-macroglobulin, partial [Thermodesulfobacteriota bacterium]|nr:alpha-2-macroglobulin [Thermodesulfobacteriota bacterium]
MRHKYFGFFLFLCFFFASGAFAEDGPQVEMFSPQGTVKGVRQVSVRFSEQMVPFGDPRSLVDPFDIDCTEKGASRWADGKNWAYDFEKDLAAGIRCEFRLKPGLKALSGKEVGGQKIFSFSTGGPSIKDSSPREGSRFINEDQIFILSLDTEPDEDSVVQNVFFSIEGIQDHIGIRVVKGSEREQLLQATKNWYWKFPLLPKFMIQCKQRFPSDTRISLIWGKGVTSKTGVATDQDQILRFQTRKAFSAEFHCQRENPRAGCTPITPMELDFSAPISKDDANQIVLRGPDGKVWKPQIEDRREVRFVNRVVFKSPFPENTNFSVELPTGLKDDAGRSLINADKFPLSVRTDQYPPLAKFSARFGILEAKAEPILPVTLRNLEPEVKARMRKVDQEEGIIGKVTGKILNIQPRKGDHVQTWLRKAASASRESSIFAQEKGVREFKVPKPEGAHAFEVIGIPLKEPGLYMVELESAILGSSLLGSPKPMFVPTAVLVTNLSVHFKWGRESSLVWVTTLDTGEPVKDAVVTVRDCV